MGKNINVSLAQVPKEMMEALVTEGFYMNRSEFIRMAIEEKLFRHRELQNMITEAKLDHVLKAIPKVVRHETLKLLKEDPQIKKLTNKIFDDE